MTKGIEQERSTAQAKCDGQPVELFDQVIASSTLFDGIFTVLQSKYQSNTALGSRRVARSNNFSGFQSGTSVIRGMESSGVDSISSWGSPSGEFGFIDQNGERVLGHEVIGFQPTNFDSSKRVMNFDTGVGVDNFWMNDENPEDGYDSETVQEGDGSFFDHAGEVKRPCCQSADNNNQSKVSPVTSGAINVFVRHDGQTTTVNTKYSKDSVTMEGN